MEDRYLFKAKHLEKWHIGNIVKEPDGLYIRDIKKNVMAFINNESTICQCTGLKDKNDKLIWENDIVRDAYGNFYAVFYYNNYYRFSWICVKSDTFLVGAMWNLWSFHSFEVEVVGNIFDNPDLLEINTQNDLERHWLEKYTEENDREKREIKVKGGKRIMYVNPFILGVIVGAFSMLVSIVILALIITGKKGK